MPTRFRNILAPAATCPVVIALWYTLWHLLAPTQRFLLPLPHEILAALRDNFAILAHAILNTTKGALLGFTLAVALSLLSAVLLSLSRLIRASLYPYMMVLQMTPILIMAPILVLWVGPGLPSVVVITFMMCFFPLVVNTTQGLISTDRGLVELFKLYRATKWQTLFRLRLPGALPYFFTGLRIAAILAPIGALVGDYTAGSSVNGGSGLGFQAVIFSGQGKYAALFATAGLTCLLGFLFATAVISLSWLCLHKWHDSYHQHH
ncbi:ABC transporter permease [Cephaloticoccus primus]|uniref:ABC transporter permease n=1 Tax=Cephaloticoccus primus TaxID=1548207 RepID=A0A139SLH7_9BACT|nr:ABC transporter permease [Cephaloticoccus primus]KXU35413.1 ABC transporter permease [Cephaloticoccus primus]